MGSAPFAAFLKNSLLDWSFLLLFFSSIITEMWTSIINNWKISRWHKVRSPLVLHINVIRYFILSNSYNITCLPKENGNISCTSSSTSALTKTRAGISTPSSAISIAICCACVSTTVIASVIATAYTSALTDAVTTSIPARVVTPHRRFRLCFKYRRDMREGNCS